MNQYRLRTDNKMQEKRKKKKPRLGFITSVVLDLEVDGEFLKF